jgi:signal transduction histidine kinase
MDHFDKLKQQVYFRVVIYMLLQGFLPLGLWIAGEHYLKLAQLPLAIICVVVGALSALLWATLTTNVAVTPVKVLWRAILHVSGVSSTYAAPDIEAVTIGKELLATLTVQVYEMASKASHLKNESQETTTAFTQLASSILSHAPLPIFVLDKDQTILFHNEAANTFIKKPETEIASKKLYDVLNMQFSEETTFEAWLTECQKGKLTDNKTWDRVRLQSDIEGVTRRFDLAAHYSKEDPSGLETILMLFDQTERYQKEDHELSFVALAVHELRTPLTTMRGYIEVFDELRDSLDAEQADFLEKLDASAQQLNAFVNNILNVARMEGNQLTFRLTEEDWQKVLESTISSLELRAKVNGKHIELKIDPNLPKVGIDQVSAQEVVNNLIDNAIKYSGKSTKIVVSATLKDGFVETSVQDFGFGIPTSVLGNIFGKFYRDHRNRGQVGGTGLGLYLSKAIVTAHGGQIWVRSKEDEKSIFTFTLPLYSSLAEEMKKGDNKGITRGAHGWIKNHSYYRR